MTVRKKDIVYSTSMCLLYCVGESENGIETLNKLYLSSVPQKGNSNIVEPRSAAAEHCLQKTNGYSPKNIS